MASHECTSDVAIARHVARARAQPPAERDVMQRSPRPPDESIFAHGMASHICWVGLLIGGLALATQAWACNKDQAEWQTMVFTVLVFAQLCHCLAIRSERLSLFSIGPFSNPALLAAILVTVVGQLAVIYLPLFNTVFRTVPLSPAKLGACVGIAALVFLVDELEKAVRRRRGP